MVCLRDRRALASWARGGGRWMGGGGKGGYWMELVVNGAKRSGIGVEYALVNTWVDLDRYGFWMKYMKNY